MPSREQVDHYFGSPLEQGSAHPDASSNEDEIAELFHLIAIYEVALVKIGQMSYSDHIGEAVGIARKALRDGNG